jgi:hypothetical protein
MSETNGLTPCCANCRFYEWQDDERGTCNRYAPKPAQGETWAEWPSVLPHNWCGEWAQPLSDDELFAEFLARNAGAIAMPLPAGIPVLPTDDQPAKPADPSVITYDTPFEDPLR